MAMYWTEFPERIETFGDLFSVLETLDWDFKRGSIVMGSHDKETDQSAYTVEYGGGTYQVFFRLDRVPGLDRLTTYAEREYGAAVTLPVLRLIRGRVSEVRDLASADVDRMTVCEVACALAESDPAADDSPGGDPLAAEFRWLKVTQVARLFALNAGQVSKLADTGTLVSNGQTGHDRRIDVLSVVRRELERLKRQEPED